MKIIFFAAMLFFVSCSDSKTNKYSHLPEHQQKMIRAKELNNEAGSVYVNSGYKPSAALPLIDSAIALFPKYVHAYQNKAALLWKQKDYDELLKVNAILRQIMPVDDWKWDFHRAMVLEAKGDTAAAKAQFDAALTLYRKFYKDMVLPSIELPYLMYYIDFLSFCGLQKESDEKLKELRDKYAAAQPGLKDWKARTKEEWMNWGVGSDATDYSDPQWANFK